MKDSTKHSIEEIISKLNVMLRAISELEDVNNASDIVEEARDIGLSPATNNQTDPNFGQLSFAPYSDPSEETMIRSAFARHSEGLKVYRCCKRSEVLSIAYWFAVPQMAMAAAEEGDVKVFSATINPKAKLMIFNSPPDQEIIQQAKIGDVDGIVFQNKDFIILNPNVLGNIEDELDRADINDSMIEVGERDNYTGLAPNFFPASSGLMPAGHGCAAGPTTLPFGLQF
jgi:hypothetical protein